MTNSLINPLKKYWPLISLIIISFFAAIAINWNVRGDMTALMHYFMGFFLVVFSTLKIFRPIEFANAFVMYDLIAMRYRLYAYLYPVIELLLGLAYLSFFVPRLTYCLTIIVLSLGALGVLKALHRGIDMNCPCMGTVLNVPLSTVTLTEDVAMIFMALMLLIGSWL